MAVIIYLLTAYSPLFSWGDSLYLDAPRMGKVEDYSVSGRTCYWVYTDIAVMERNSASGWVIGLCPVKLNVKPEIDALIQSASIDSVESADLEEITTYWIGEDAYPSQYFRGPWTQIDALMSRLTPSFTVDIHDEPVGGGARAVHGTLYWGDQPVFRSLLGTYQLQAPPASVGLTQYLDKITKRDSVELDQIALDGIMYLQGDFPLFFYVKGGK
jgi:hypothetical protein